MGLPRKDIRIFFNKHTNCYIIANDHLKRKLISRGYELQKAKDNSHGHVRNIRAAENIKECILSNKRTKERDIYTLECYLRVTDKEYKHYKWVKELLETKIDKLR